MSKIAKEFTMTDKDKLKDDLTHQLVQLADYNFTINRLFNADSLH